MTEESVEAALTRVGLDVSLLAAKLSIPDSRPGFVRHEALITAARASDCRVVGVTAPAGYGKSTLLAEWAQREDRPVAWVSLDRLDDDPAVLLFLIASAFAEAVLGDSSVVIDAGPGASVLGRMAPRVAAALRGSPEPFVLMLDDLHEIRSLASHDALSVAIAGIPTGSQLVAASRAEQPHLPRLRASGDAMELGVTDLALDVSGTEQVFSTAKVGVTHDTAETVTERTEGWPIGVYLAAEIAREGTGDAQIISGDDRFVADYLQHEAFTRLPDEHRVFLRRTAVLEQLSGVLCDGLLGGSNSQAMLRELEASSHFLVPLDRQRRWYRYHALFREFLLAELRSVEPEIVDKLHLKAADWYEANGLPVLALEHLMHTAERDRCVALVSELLLPTYATGQIATVLRWLAELGDAAIETYPPLAVTAGWMFALDGQANKALRWLDFIDRATFEHVPVDGTASFTAFRAMLRSIMCPDGPERAMADADLALSAEPPSSPWREIGLGVAGEARLLAGDVDRARAIFEEGVVARRSVTNAHAFLRSELAMLALDRGSWDEAAEHLQVALDSIEVNRTHDYVTSAMTYVAAARLALHRGDARGAERELTRGMRTRPHSTHALPGMAVRLRLELAKVHWTIGETSTVRHLLREISDLLRHRPDLGALVDEVSDFAALVTPTTQAGVGGAAPLTSAELRLLPYLQTHLMIREIADRLDVSRNTVSSQVSSIYRKLGVSSRTAAVQQATELGLLGN